MPREGQDSVKQAGPAPEPALTAEGAADGSMDFSALVSVADELPVMIGFLDRDQVFRFANKPLAEWLEKPRSEILGHPFAEVIGPQAYRTRAPMIEAALAGERKLFAATFPHWSRGELALQTHYVPWKDSSGTVSGVLCIVTIPRLFPAGKPPAGSAARNRT